MSIVHIQVGPVAVKKDAMSTVTTCIPQHELAVLAKLFGMENISPADEATTVHEFDTDTEAQRLAGKYGQEVVNAVFGDDGGLRLAEILVKLDVGVPSAASTEQAAFSGKSGKSGKAGTQEGSTGAQAGQGGGGAPSGQGSLT